MFPDAFLDFVAARTSDWACIDTVTDFSGVQLLIANDEGARFWTSFDDEFIVFDQYDKEVDATVQSSKTQVLGYREPVFLLLDSTIPDLPSKNFAYLLSESKSVCFNTLSQEPNAKEEQRSRRQRTWSSIEKFRTNGGIRFPENYGR